LSQRVRGFSLQAFLYDESRRKAHQLANRPVRRGRPADPKIKARLVELGGTVLALSRADYPSHTDHRRPRYSS
jgi:hypothetical protein